jgi:hypothetical protein
MSSKVLRIFTDFRRGGVEALGPEGGRRLERAAIVETLLPQNLGSGHHKNQDTKKRYKTGPESSSGAENTTKMHSKTSPTHLERSRGPNSDPKIRAFPAGNRPAKSPPVSTIGRPSEPFAGSRASGVRAGSGKGRTGPSRRPPEAAHSEVHSGMLPESRLERSRLAPTPQWVPDRISQAGSPGPPLRYLCIRLRRAKRRPGRVEVPRQAREQA